MSLFARIARLFTFSRQGQASIGFAPFLPVDRKIGLHTRMGLLLGGLALILLLLLAGLWLQATRNSVHEEVEAATRVSRQWLQALIGEMQGLSVGERRERLLIVLRHIGRVRANGLEVWQAGSTSPSYIAPPSSYKAGRAAPGWFADLLTPPLPAQEIAVDDLRLRLLPDASRAVLDAWDELVALAGWAGLLLAALFFGIRLALRRALQPLDEIMGALDRTGRGRFDTRLPIFPDPELGRLARAFNGMADRLAAAVDENVRLETSRELAERMQSRLEAERRDIARELHDELAQGITAVRALAGALAQRMPDNSQMRGMAQCIGEVAESMQAGVRSILQRLRPLPAGGLDERLTLCLAHWRQRHSQIELISKLTLGSAPLPDALTQTVLRIVQEGLTNVVRHAQATRVELDLSRAGEHLHLQLRDNGQGCGLTPSAQAGSGLGLAGMRERIAQLGGQLEFSRPSEGGFALCAILPIHKETAQ